MADEEKKELIIAGISGSPGICIGQAYEVRRQLGADETLDGHPCYRLELETPRSQFTLLVDQKLAVVRRVEYHA